MCVCADYGFAYMCLCQAIVQSMKKKHYSFLDQRRTDFDVDYEEFCQSTTELHVSDQKTQNESEYLWDRSTTVQLQRKTTRHTLGYIVFLSSRIS